MPWTPTHTASSWGRLQLVVNGRDVTFWRDVPTQIGRVAWTEPFDDSTLTFTLPQCTPFETIGDAGRDMAWMERGANVDLYHIRPDATKVAIWEGLWQSEDWDLAPNSQGLSVSAVGALHQVDMYLRAPEETAAVRNIADWLVSNLDLNIYPNLRTQWLRIEGPKPGFVTNQSGAWDKRLTGHIQDQLQLMVEADGTQWTMMLEPGRQPVLRKKNYTTEHWTVDLGAEGLELRLSRDWSQAPNVYYGEGSDSAGSTWRNSRQFLGFTVFRPLAIAPEVDSPFFDLWGDPAFDAHKIRQETRLQFGDHISLDEAVDVAQRQLERDADPGWAGTITLRTDPHEGSRFDIRAGHNVRLRYFQGTSGKLFHVAAAEVDFAAGTTTLTVDTKARDLLPLDQLLSRQRAISASPAGRLRVDRESGVTQDTEVPWDGPGGYGAIPLASHGRAPGDTPTTHPEQYVHALAGLWVVAAFFVGTRASIKLTDVRAYDAAGVLLPTPFHVSFYGEEPAIGQLPPDPFAADAWTPEIDGAGNQLSPPRSLIIGWGADGQRAGYWPGLDSNGDPETGILRDEGTWSYDVDSTSRFLMWAAFWCPVEAWFQGRITKAVG